MLARTRALSLRAVLPATWLAWLLPVFAWAPLAYPGYFEFHNGFSPIFNLDALLHSRAGLAWLPSVGQPYDLLRGEGWLAYRLAILPRWLGLSSATAVKLVLAGAILAGALGTYGWARRSFGDWPGLVAAAVYVFWPLGLATVYVRGAYAEAVLLGLLPWAWWAAGAAREPGRWGARAGLALALAAAFWTQAGLGLWQSGLVLIYLLASGAMARRAGSAPRTATAAALLAWLAGVALGWLGCLPAALAHGGLGNATYASFAAHFVYPHQLLQPGLSPAPGGPGSDAGMPLQLGLVACGLAAVGLVLLFAGPAPDEAAQAGATIGVQEIKSKSVLAAALVLLPVLGSLQMAAPLWQALASLQRTLTYPWQLLLLAGPWLAWLAGLGGWVLGSALPGADGAGARQRLEDAAGTAAPSYSIPLFAGLLALALLGVYGDLNPSGVQGPVPERPVAIFGDNEIALLSSTVTGVTGPGDRVTVHARWQALRPLDQDYTVFLHALAPDGSLAGQLDTMPRANKLPTSHWQPGTIIDDEYSLILKPDAPFGGDYQFQLGLYRYQTGQRLQAGTDDKVVLSDE